MKRSAKQGHFSKAQNKGERSLDEGNIERKVFQCLQERLERQWRKAFKKTTLKARKRKKISSM